MHTATEKLIALRQQLAADCMTRLSECPTHGTQAAGLFFTCINACRPLYLLLIAEALSYDCPRMFFRSSSFCSRKLIKPWLGINIRKRSTGACPLINQTSHINWSTKPSSGVESRETEKYFAVLHSNNFFLNVFS